MESFSCRDHKPNRRCWQSRVPGHVAAMPATRPRASPTCIRRVRMIEADTSSGCRRSSACSIPRRRIVLLTREADRSRLALFPYEFNEAVARARQSPAPSCNSFRLLRPHPRRSEITPNVDVHFEGMNTGGRTSWPPTCHPRRRSTFTRSRPMHSSTFVAKGMVWS